MARVVQEGDCVGAGLLDALDELGDRQPQGGLISVPDDDDVARREADALQRGRQSGRRLCADWRVRRPRAGYFAFVTISASRVSARAADGSSTHNSKATAARTIGCIPSNEPVGNYTGWREWGGNSADGAGIGPPSFGPCRTP